MPSRRHYRRRNFATYIKHEISIFTSYFAGFGANASLHGVKYIFTSRLHPIERLLWLILFSLTLYYAYQISSTQYERYIASPTVISLERDYREWNGTLPAITICYHKRLDIAKAETLIYRFWAVRRGDAEFNYFMDYVRAVVYVNESNLRFNRFVNDKRLEFVNMLTIAKEVHPSVNSMITSFDTNAEFRLNEVVTERGICYSVNAILWPLISSNGMDPEKLNLQTKSLTCFFMKNQCYMKLDVYDPTVFIAIHSPFEVATESTQFFDMGMTDEIESTYNMLETISSHHLRKLNVAQRKCYFMDEKTEFLPVYSFNACSMLCKAKAALKLCGCRPYFYPFMNGSSCSPSGLLCLTSNMWPNSVKCRCSKTCIEIIYTQNNLKKINWAVDGGIPFTQKSSFRYEVIPPRMRLKRDVLFSYEDLIVSFGGIAALFLGLNLWDFSEFLFFVLTSFVKYFYLKFKDFF